VLLLQNTVQPYAWGAIDGVAQVVGSEPSGGAEAELWVGTHPLAPSVVVDDPAGRTLAEVIASDPVRWLGAELAASGHTALPFLLKVLAIGRPLSLQAHPSAAEACAGFAREEAAGTPLTSPIRTYRDPNPKPEALVALRPTAALCGFRPAHESAALVRSCAAPALDPLERILAEGGPEAQREALSWLLHLDGGDRVEVAAVAATVGSGQPDRSPLAWAGVLATHYPGDPTALAPLLLAVVELEPGDALHLPAGNLHAYLGGAGVEIMAASDNVLRGGLTPKHIDVDELLAILRFGAGVPAGPTRRNPAPGVTTYDAGETSFALAVVDAPDAPVVIEPRQPSLLLATDGPVAVGGTADKVQVDHGRAVFVAPGEGPLEVSGPGRLWWATVGDGLPA
jgi:mannose-6-phosphate isomerase